MTYTTFLEMLNPTVEIMGFKWAEPMTTVTDFSVAVVSGYAVYRLLNIPKDQRNGSVFPLFVAYFLSFTIGMTCAAWLGHGFQEYITPRNKIFGWMFGATGLMFLQQGSKKLIEHELPSFWSKSLPWLFVIEWILVIILTLNPETSSFKVIQLNSVFALILTVLPMHIFNWKKLKVAASFGIVLALAYSIVPGLVYSNQIGFHRWFNHHDISHVLMAIFMFLMFSAIYKLAQKQN